MLVVHHLNNSRSQRLLWLLEELGLAYEIEKYERDPATMLAPDALKKIHPLGKSPVLEDGANRVAESGAILEYILDAYADGRLRPRAGTPERLTYTYWTHYAEGSAMPILLMRLIFSRIAAQKGPPVVQSIVRTVGKRALSSFVDPQLTRHVDYWEAHLGENAWFAGDEFSGADIMMSFPVEGAAKRFGVTDRPKLNAWLETIHARPAYQTALERGGQYDLLS